MFPWWGVCWVNKCIRSKRCRRRCRCVLSLVPRCVLVKSVLEKVLALGVWCLRWDIIKVNFIPYFAYINHLCLHANFYRIFLQYMSEKNSCKVQGCVCGLMCEHLIKIKSTTQPNLMGIYFNIYFILYLYFFIITHFM